MPTFEPVVIAAVQATPVILDADATVDKAARLIGEAAAEGAQLVVLPETFVSLYPSNAWAHQAARFGGSDELWERMWDSSVEVPGPLVDRLVAACAEARRPLRDRRKRARARPAGDALQHAAAARPRGAHLEAPQAHAHPPGAGLPRDRRGRRPRRRRRPLSGASAGLICWENRMPLARWAIYQGGPQIWIAPTADDSDGWIASMRHIAIESGAFVVSAPSVHPARGVPGRLPGAAPRPGGVRQRRRRDRRSRVGRGRSPGRSTARRAWSPRRATYAAACTRSAGSTRSATTAARTCSRRLAETGSASPEVRPAAP